MGLLTSLSGVLSKAEVAQWWSSRFVNHSSVSASFVFNSLEGHSNPSLGLFWARLALSWTKFWTKERLNSRLYRLAHLPRPSFSGTSLLLFSLNLLLSSSQFRIHRPGLLVGTKLGTLLAELFWTSCRTLAVFVENGHELGTRSKTERHEENRRLPASPTGRAAPRFPYRAGSDLHGRYSLVRRGVFLAGIFVAGCILQELFLEHPRKPKRQN